ncbi:phosphatidate cytidylyltransferase [Actibacterium pelagium]|uniref:Phosphatidate cytidylyltransferase n=1 Tax=Actibacterium pelagium TaxID=2029103 RepID=A0A917EHU4_9RHOB|nr:phosphatidate cytidylyltransferase [Actibacterium pelagium]GGE42268.1 phosphatidate cytidylyltransferase [Actibacterium pelagium]
MAGASKWDDLRDRMISGLAMAVVGLGLVWAGGPWFAMLAAFVSGVMLWELSRMVAPEKVRAAWQIGVLGAASVLLANSIPYGAVLLLAPLIYGAYLLQRWLVLFVAFGIAILAAGYGLIEFRNEHGMVWIVWLMLVVIATDIFGYFAGRFIGGPKFWPAVSPKKTWSGIVAGWLAAIAIGFIFRTFTNAGVDLPWVSMLLSMASQAGDFAESGLKRKMGVKDSSNLLPGHGGLFDRFDGMLGAVLFMLIVAQVVYVPEVRF